MGTLSPICQLLSPTPSRSLQLRLRRPGGSGQGIKALEGPEERAKGREADHRPRPSRLLQSLEAALSCGSCQWEALGLPEKTLY